MERTKYPTPCLGKPRKHPTIQHLQAAIDAYFESCWKRTYKEVVDPQTQARYIEEVVTQVRPYTVTGLAVGLGFESREALLYYEDIDEDYLCAIKKAKLKCHMYAEESLFRNTQVAGTIFNLKNNYGWQDRTTTEMLLPEGINITNADERAKRNRENLLEQAQGMSL